MATAAANKKINTTRRKATPASWSLKAETPDADLIRQMAKDLNVSLPFARLLVRRGHSNPSKAEQFLALKLDGLHDPGLLKDMDLAVARIEKAVENQECVVLFGDYDVDGVSSTALLQAFFDVLKFPVKAMVPERNKGGYGLSKDALARILEAKPDLVITLDNGIGAHDAVEALTAEGIDTVITDHHHVGVNGIPKAVAVVNPKRSDCTYPFKELCGAGLAFKLCWALAVSYSGNKKVAPKFRSFLLDALALAALGTLADVVPLVDENRLIAAHGLRAICTSPLPGLKALLEVCDLKPGVKPTSTDVSFRIAPRINAAGRCGQAADALDLLTTQDPARAAALAQRLEQLNTERRLIEQRIHEDARSQALAILENDTETRLFVLASNKWHVGIIGIVASRIVEEFHRPAILLAIDDEEGLACGSGRSIHGFHLAEALQATSEHLETHGGHAAAAGLKIKINGIKNFQGAMRTHGMETLSAEDLKPVLSIEDTLELGEITGAFCRELERLEPCGPGNHRPTLAACNIETVGQIKPLGADEKHVSFFASHNGTALRAIGFGMGSDFNSLCDLAASGPFDIAFRPGLNTWRGQTNVELRLRAFGPAGMV